ncbi:MAG: TetR/AcrR family transcriptional regulator [Rhodospirillales bacterium]|nr:TetR/AcrR family transcriptional regulator [Rhodospirillales bacterium]
MPDTTRAPRQDNRRIQLLDAAAALFAEHGFHAVSMRDIARNVGMLPGSMYYHFPSKNDLLLATYEEGVRQLSQRVDMALADEDEPWARLEAACKAHAEILLNESDYAQVILSVFPRDVAAISDNLKPLRDGYEDRFRILIEALPLAADVDRNSLRLMLLGALNWSKNWYNPRHGSPREIATDMLALLKRSLV